MGSNCNIYLVEFNLPVWLWKACTEVHDTRHLQPVIFYPLSMRINMKWSKIKVKQIFIYLFIYLFIMYR